MFFNCFNLTGAGLANWNTSNVTSMRDMFRINVAGPGVFNCDISGWDTSSVTHMGMMFKRQDSFNQNLAAWDIESVGNFSNFMQENEALSTANYNATLIGWAAQNAVDSLSVHFGDATSSGTGTDARTSLEDDDSWTIVDGDS